MRTVIQNSIKKIILMGAVCMPLSLMAADKSQNTIEVIDLDKITIIEGQTSQPVQSSVQPDTPTQTKRVITQVNTVSDVENGDVKNGDIKNGDVKKGDIKNVNVENVEKSQLMKKAEKIITQSEDALKVFKQQAYADEMREKLRTARAVIIFPNIIKASVIFGVAGGEGVLLVRDDNNNWSYPSFYKTSQAGFGLQMGATSTVTITIIQTQLAVNNLLNRTFRLEAGMNAALGNVGEGEGFSFGKDIRSFAISKGAAMGVSLDGQSILPTPNINQAYYKAFSANTQTIIYDALFTNAQADGLRASLDNF